MYKSDEGFKLTADVNLSKFTLKLGDWVQNNDLKYGKGTRISDFMLNHLRNFAAASITGRSEVLPMIILTLGCIMCIF